MAEYIDKRAAIADLNETYDKMAGFHAQFYNGYQFAVNRLRVFPTAEVEPVRHGRWEVKCELHRCDHTGEYDEDYHLECSVCHRKVWDVSQDALITGDIEKATKDFPFCHCGARMDGGEGDA